MSPREEDLPVLLATDVRGHFHFLVEAYQHKLFALTCFLVGNQQDAEEIVQDVFFCAYQALMRYPVQQVQTLKLRPWMTKIVLNLSRNYHRRCNGKYAPTSMSFDAPMGRELVDSIEEKACPSPEEEMVTRESRDDLLAQIANLPERYREVVSLHYIYGLPHYEIATILGHHSVDTVKSQARRGFEMLKQAMNKEER
jgi:RNA polymerase sigma factor (sigma-70 family)